MIAAAGTYAITARATDSRTSTATSAPLAVTVAPYVPPPPVLSISASPGIDGSTVNEATVLVSGTITAPPNSGVTVNGMLAAVGSGGQFSVNDVPLAAGANTLTLTVTTQDGETASQAIAVTSSGAGAPYAVSVNPPEGVAPLDVAFSVSGSSTLPVATIEFDLDGDGSVDYTASSLAAANITATYSTPGVARPRITFKDSAGMVLYTTTRQVPIANAVDKYNLLKGVYSDVVSRLTANNGDYASGLFVDTRRDAYRSFFSQLGATLTTVAGQLGTLRGGSITDRHGELVIVRDTPEGPTAFPIQVIRGSDGIWRIESM